MNNDISLSMYAQGRNWKLISGGGEGAVSKKFVVL